MKKSVSTRSYRISVDTGGTFTDVVIASSAGILSIGKALTTHERIFLGFWAALEVAASGIGLTASDVLRNTTVLIYGTTRAMNAVVTGKTAKTALLTTKGFRDVLLFKEGGKYDPHDFSYDYPEPYVPRRYTFEIDERIDSEGGIVKRLDENAARRLVRSIKKQKFEAISVCLLWSVANSAHEKMVGQIFEEEMPGVPYTLSHELIPIVREYRRASTSAIDASLKPLMQEHLREMDKDLREAGFGGEALISTSSGGTRYLDDGAREPVRILKSGPAMAPVAGKAYAAIEKLGGSAIVCDTGGTTFDVALVRDGALTYTRDSWIGRPKTGHIVALSSVDVRSIGAGGGSIAWVDEGGLLRVGPESAGADPGPACYGRGGRSPTVTDAALVLGYIDPAYFNGGRMPLDENAALSAVARLGKQIGKNTRETAAAIITIWSEHMIKAIREMTVQEGIDPKESILVAGGGAAGINATSLARELGCDTIVIPRYASAMSACGMHYSDLVFEETRSLVTHTGAFNKRSVNAQLQHIDAALEKFRKSLPKTRGATFKKEFFAEARYVGQVWEIDTPLKTTHFTSERDVQKLADTFHAVHERLYAVRDEASRVECINWRGRISVSLGKFRDAPLSPRSKHARDHKKRPAYFEGKRLLTPVYLGEHLSPGSRVLGPAIIEEPTTTIVLPPGAHAHVSHDAYILSL